MRTKLASIEARLTAITAEADGLPGTAGLTESLERLVGLIREHAPDPELPLEELRQEWQRYRRELVDGYHDLSRRLDDWDIHLPHLRPTNYSRNLVHVSLALWVPPLIAYGLDRTQMIALAVGFCCWAWPTEILRRVWPGYNRLLMRVLGRFAHPHEWHRVNSATWYCTALAILALTATKPVCIIAVVVLAVADPAAAVIGRRWGRTRLLHGRSLEGSLAFLISGTVAAWLVLTSLYPQLDPVGALWVCAAASFPAAVAEAVSRRIDDNLTIPLAAAAGAAVAWGPYLG